MINRLSKATLSGQIRVVDLGESVQHRHIPMVAIGPDNARVRVMVLCRQHGDEPVSTGAALKVIERAAAGDPIIRHAGLALAYFHLGQYPLEIAEFNRLLILKPGLILGLLAFNLLIIAACVWVFRRLWHLKKPFH